MGSKPSKASKASQSMNKQPSVVVIDHKVQSNDTNDQMKPVDKAQDNHKTNDKTMDYNALLKLIIGYIRRCEKETSRSITLDISKIIQLYYASKLYFYSSTITTNNQTKTFKSLIFDCNDYTVLCTGFGGLMTVNNQNTITSIYDHYYSLQNETITAMSNGYCGYSFISTASQKMFVIGKMKYLKPNTINQNNNTQNGPVEIKYFNTIFKDINIKQIECGHGHTVFLSECGKTWSFGNNRFGQCGQSLIHQNISDLPELMKDLKGINIVEIACGGNHNLALSDCGIVYCFGNFAAYNLPHNVYSTPQYDGQVVIHSYFKDNNIKISHVKCGAHHNLVLDDEHFCYLFGWNPCGQCGPKNPVIWKFQDEKVVDMSGSGRHSVLLTKDTNNVYTLGDNKNKACSTLKPGIKEFWSPYLLGKEEIGMQQYEIIRRVIARYGETIIVTEVAQK